MLFSLYKLLRSDRQSTLLTTAYHRKLCQIKRDNIGTGHGAFPTDYREQHDSYTKQKHCVSLINVVEAEDIQGYRFQIKRERKIPGF